MVRAASSLPGAGRARDQDAALVGATFSIDLAQLVDRRRMARPCVVGAGASCELVDLALQARGLQRALGDQHQPVGLERLLDEVVGAALDRRDRGLDVAVARDHHHRQLRVLLLDRCRAAAGRRAGALQPDVEEDEMRPARLDRRRAPRRCSRAVRVAMALVLQNAGDELADVGLVVDDEDVGAPCYRLVATCAESALQPAVSTAAALGRKPQP